VAPRPILVEQLEQSPCRLGRLGATGPANVKDERGADLAGVDRPEHLRGPCQVARLLGRQGEPDVLPPCGKAVLDRMPLIDELHRASA